MGPGSNSAIIADSDSDDDASPAADAEDIEAAGGMSPDAAAAAARAKRARASQEAGAAVVSRLGSGMDAGDLEAGAESESEGELNAAVAELEDELLRHGSGDVLDPEAGDLDVSLSDELQDMVGSDVDIDLTSSDPSPSDGVEAAGQRMEGVLDPELEAAAHATAAAGVSSDNEASGGEDGVSGDGVGEGSDDDEADVHADEAGGDDTGVASDDDGAAADASSDNE